MFKIQKRDTYPWTVEHVVAVVQGKPELMKFDAEFKALPSSRATEILGALQTGKMKDPEFLAEVLSGWHGLGDGRTADGQEFKFDQTNLELLIELYPGIVGSFTQAWMESISGAAARKN